MTAETLESVLSASRSFAAERDIALAALDLSWAAKIWPDKTDDERLVALHQTRYETTTLPDPVRLFSRSWLEVNGHGRALGIAWPPRGTLPEPPAKPNPTRRPITAAEALSSKLARRYVMRAVNDQLLIQSSRDRAKLHLQTIRKNQGGRFNEWDIDRVAGQIIGSTARTIATGIVEGLFPRPLPPVESEIPGTPQEAPASGPADEAHA